MKTLLQSREYTAQKEQENVSLNLQLRREE
jgi:hypothetical protein